MPVSASGTGQLRVPVIAPRQRGQQRPRDPYGPDGAASFHRRSPTTGHPDQTVPALQGHRVSAGPEVDQPVAQMPLPSRTRTFNPAFLVSDLDRPFCHP
jgi:hypothetical protein